MTEFDLSINIPQDNIEKTIRLNNPETILNDMEVLLRKSFTLPPKISFHKDKDEHSSPLDPFKTLEHYGYQPKDSHEPMVLYIYYVKEDPNKKKPSIMDSLKSPDEYPHKKFKDSPKSSKDKESHLEEHKEHKNDEHGNGNKRKHMESTSEKDDEEFESIHKKVKVDNVPNKEEEQDHTKATEDHDNNKQDEVIKHGEKEGGEPAPEEKIQ